MDDTQQGRELLKEFERTTKFDKFEEGADTALKPISDLVDLLEGE